MLNRLIEHLRGASDAVDYCMQVEKRLEILRVALQDFPEFDALIEWVIAPEDNKPLLPLVRAARERIQNTEPPLELREKYDLDTATRDAVQVATLTEIEKQLDGITDK